MTEFMSSFMDDALAEAHAAASAAEVPVGCAIVRAGAVIVILAIRGPLMFAPK